MFEEDNKLAVDFPSHLGDWTRSSEAFNPIELYIFIMHWGCDRLSLCASGFCEVCLQLNCTYTFVTGFVYTRASYVSDFLV